MPDKKSDFAVRIGDVVHSTPADAGEHPGDREIFPGSI